MPDFPSNQNLSDRARQRIDQMGPDYRHPDDSVRGTSASAPSSLEAQTPGLDKTRFFRVAGNRIVSWSREQPALIASIGLFVGALMQMTQKPASSPPPSAPPTA